MVAQSVAAIVEWSSLFLLACARIGWPLTLEGSPGSFARFPRWYQAFENILSFEFNTHQLDALLVYTDDGGVGNFYEIRLIGGNCVRLTFKLGREGSMPRPLARLVASGKTYHRQQADYPVVLELTADAGSAENLSFSDGSWHKVELFQFWEKVKLTIDDKHATFVTLEQQDFVFGRYDTNSEVFVGGLPTSRHTVAKLSCKPTSVARPLAGSVRNLVFRTLPHGITAPLLLDAKGLRQSDDSQCGQWGVCANGVPCFSTDDGPKCDCGYDFEGDKCQFEKDPLEVTLSGSEFFSFDFSVNQNSLLSRDERLSLFFKTSQPSAMLFYSGDNNQDFVHLAIKNGAMTAASNFAGIFKEVVLRKFADKPTNSATSFNDNRWHYVRLHRKILRQHSDGKIFLLLSLNIDGVYSEMKQFLANFQIIVTTVAFLGGKPRNRFIAQILEDSNFIGCLGKVQLVADGCNVDFLHQTKDSGGFVEISDNITFMCRVSTSSRPLSFKQPGAFVEVPSALQLAQSSTFTLKFKTNEPDGLLLYARGAVGSSDFIALELVDGLIYLVLDLGTGLLRLQASTVPIKNRHWHTITVFRDIRSGKIMLDGETTEFSTPGSAMTFDLSDPIYVGGLPQKLDVSPSVWSKALKKSFFGCIKEFSINSVAINLADFLPQNNSHYWSNAGVHAGCEEPRLQCTSSPCLKDAHCVDGWSRFFCDCSKTMKSGLRCEKDLLVLNLKVGEFLHIPMEKHTSEVEDIQLKFKTTNSSCLLILSSNSNAINSSNSFKIFLADGQLKYWINLRGSVHTFSLSNNLNDGFWHTAKVRRRATKLELSLDNDALIVSEIPENIALIAFDSVFLGSSPHDQQDPNIAHETFASIQNDENIHRRSAKFHRGFQGQLASFIFNGVNIFESLSTRNPKKIYRYLATNLNANENFFSIEKTWPENMGGIWKDKKPSVKSLDYADRGSVTLTSSRSFAVLKLSSLNTTNGFSKLSFAFRTLQVGGMIFCGPGFGGYFAVELFHSRIRFIFSGLDATQAIQSKKDRLLNDFSYHTVTMHKVSSSQYDLSVDGHTQSIFTGGVDFMSNAHSLLYVGDVKRVNGTFEGSPPAFKAVASKVGFRGCLSALTVDGRPIDLIGDALVYDELRLGCEGPINQCSLNSCTNGGVCLQRWNDHYCDCAMTTFTGPKCSQIRFSDSISYKFGPSPTVILYGPIKWDKIGRMDIKLAFGLVTNMSKCVVMHLESVTSSDFLSVQLDDGYIVVQFEFGSGRNYLGDFVHRVNDEKFHKLRLIRVANNSTLQIDDYEIVMKTHLGKTENIHSSPEQQHLHVGGRLNLSDSLSGRVRRNPARHQILDHFTGFLTGFSFNNLRLLEKAAENDPLVKSYGDLTFYGSQQPIFLISSRNDADNSFPLDGVGYTAGGSSDDMSTEFITGDDLERAECMEMDNDEKCVADDDQSTTEIITPVYRPIELTASTKVRTTVAPSLRQTRPIPLSTTVIRLPSLVPPFTLRPPTASSATTRRIPPWTAHYSPPLPRPTAPYSPEFVPSPTTVPRDFLLMDTQTEKSSDTKFFSKSDLIIGVGGVLLIILLIVIIVVYLCRGKAPEEYSAIEGEGVRAKTKASVLTNMHAFDLKNSKETRPTTFPLDSSQKSNGSQKNGRYKKDVKEWYV